MPEGDARGDEPGASAQRADQKGEAELAARVLIATWREGGLAGCARKLRAAVAMGLPVVIAGTRTAQSVGAYFDLITADARLFYGESFHLGYFSQGSESLREALDAHTDLVAGLARVKAAAHVLDVGCGLGAPALRIAQRYGCRITGVNISREQVRQGCERGPRRTSGGCEHISGSSRARRSIGIFPLRSGMRGTLSGDVDVDDEPGRRAVCPRGDRVLRRRAALKDLGLRG
jgi:hypothetical protein